MRIFHVNAYEGFIAAGQPVYSSPSYSDLFGSVERIHASGYASQVTGATATLVIQEGISMDGENWSLGNFLIGPTPLPLTVAPAETPFQGADGATDHYIFGAKTAFRRLVITVAGAGANAMVRVWVTGRDRSRRAKSLAQGR